MKPIIQLALSDIKNVRRDPMLLMVVFGMAMIAIVFKIVPPILSEWLLLQFQFDLTSYFDLLTVFILQLVPLLIGTLAGFMLLDERDENLISYYAVTPLQKSGYLVVRLVLPYVCTVLMCVFMFYFTNLINLRAVVVIPLTLLVGLLTPLITLFLGTFAANKVEGLALSKGAGIVILAPLAVYFLPWQWQVGVSLFPTFWSAKVFFHAYFITYLLFFIAGVGYHLLLLILLYKRMQRRID
ncbi:hypothetical protein [Bacillus alkalicellulosilyticus]|uniref:hypothetical protein n=1 Tax=Alkalihalobacterium alkalicellulosilyticum TaxID=1912214 RepID=UPI000997279A|nr:hypothetical protein [Bacillus alkalicellulosilyticus]